MRKLTERHIVVATHNSGKLVEIRALLEPFGFKVTSASELGLPEPEETEDNFAGNARIKAHFAARESGLPALSDDSGIMVDALGGAPGVYTADWAETPNGRDFSMAMGKVWEALEAEDADEPRTARFVCTLCLAWPNGEDCLFEGKVGGRLVWPMRGSNGFGFDPMFLPDGKSQTFGEMDPAKKHAMSHRAEAFSEFVSALIDE
ncbi:MAG: RdgB/HAM1 family non-canonical purine NTP pyrophosphatase [Alphaproteobacteria bacterium]|nr:RdgB/HAM1 family non-canonical purine NTP pyrophosphatase [Alphaproteobacteria bacterium]